MIKLTNGSTIETIESDGVRSKYKENPSKFCEDYLGIKLNKWQKLIINLTNKEEKLIVSYPLRNGKTMNTIMLKILKGYKLDDRELNWIKKFTSEEVYNKVLDNNQSK
jgi:hypothetical protein